MYWVYLHRCQLSASPRTLSSLHPPKPEPDGNVGEYWVCGQGTVWDGAQSGRKGGKAIAPVQRGQKHAVSPMAPEASSEPCKTIAELCRAPCSVLGSVGLLENVCCFLKLGTITEVGREGCLGHPSYRQVPEEWPWSSSGGQQPWEVGSQGLESLHVPEGHRGAPGRGGPELGQRVRVTSVGSLGQEASSF